MSGGEGSDTLDGGVGSDILNGGEGTDDVNIAGAAFNYLLTKNQDGSVTIKEQHLPSRRSCDGTDTIDGVERFHFKDGMISLAGLQALQDGPISLQVAPPVGASRATRHSSAGCQKHFRIKCL